MAVYVDLPSAGPGAVSRPTGIARGLEGPARDHPSGNGPTAAHRQRRPVLSARAIRRSPSRAEQCGGFPGISTGRVTRTRRPISKPICRPGRPDGPRITAHDPQCGRAGRAARPCASGRRSIPTAVRVPSSTAWLRSSSLRGTERIGAVLLGAEGQEFHRQAVSASHRASESPRFSRRPV